MDGGSRATQDAKAEFTRVNEHFERDFTESRRLKRRRRWPNQ